MHRDNNDAMAHEHEQRNQTEKKNRRVESIVCSHRNRFFVKRTDAYSRTENQFYLHILYFNSTV